MRKPRDAARDSRSRDPGNDPACAYVLGVGQHVTPNSDRRVRTRGNMDCRALLITFAMIGLGTIRGWAQLSTAEQAAVDGYRSAIMAAESGRSRAIEAAFLSLASIREALLKVRNGED